jgi:hypothetical protein
MAVPLIALSDHMSAEGLQSGEQSSRSFALIVVRYRPAHASGPPGRLF